MTQNVSESQHSSTYGSHLSHILFKPISKPYTLLTKVLFLFHYKFYCAIKIQCPEAGKLLQILCYYSAC